MFIVKYKLQLYIQSLYFCYYLQEDTNLTLPSWSKPIYPEPLYGAASLAYSYFNYNPDIKKINAGNHL